MSKLKIVLITIVVLMAIFLAVSFIAKYVFNQKVEKEVEELFSKVKNKGEIVTKEDISELPPNVKKWLEYTGIIGKEKIVSVHVKQKADMRLEKDKPWMPVKAEQYFTSDEPGLFKTYFDYSVCIGLFLILLYCVLRLTEKIDMINK